MLAPLSFLRHYADISVPVEEYAKRMIRQGIHVDSWESLSDQVSNVVVGKVLELVHHTNADTLWVVQVDVGERVVQVVTGADNLFQGALVPVALHGAKLPGGKVIKKGKLRGVESNGMLCSGAELGLTDDFYPGAEVDGILIIQEDLAPGTDIRPHFGLDEVLLDFDILPNRPDCQCILGLARETTVALQVPLKHVGLEFAESAQGEIQEYISVAVEDPELCPRYMGRVVRNVRIEPSPLWLRRCLYRAGIRPINNVVDITNWVMLEYGQPMHAFDLRDVKGKRIIVRRAKADEKLITLDNKERTLTEDMLVIADESAATGLAGIMGGLDSEIKPDTRDVFFECASFDRTQTRVTSRNLGLRTESSARYEKGVSPHMVQEALHRAMHLIDLLNVGEVVPGEIDIYPSPKPIEPIVTTQKDLYARTGVDISPERASEILQSLFFKTETEGERIIATPPAFRQDVQGKADLAEEVLRVYGYDTLESVLPVHEVGGSNSEYYENRRMLSDVLRGDGWHEIYTYPFITGTFAEKLRLNEDSPLRQVARLVNPLSDDQAVMCPTLVQGMLESLGVNYTRQLPHAQLFEMGVRFLPEALPMEAIPHMSRTLCLGTYGLSDFFQLKSVVQRLLSLYGLKGRYVAEGPEFYHPGRKARIYIGTECIGEMGQIDALVAKNFGLASAAFTAELDLDRMMALAPEVGGMKPLPKYPAVTRDIAVLVDVDKPIGDMMDVISEVGGDLLESVSLFDVYRGLPLKENQQNVAFSLRIRSQERTLDEVEVTRMMNAIMDRLENQFGAQLRQ